MASTSSSASAARPVFTKLVEKAETDSHVLQLDIRDWSTICPKRTESFAIQRSEVFPVVPCSGQPSNWYIGIDCIFTEEHNHWGNLEIVKKVKIRPYLISDVYRSDIHGSFVISILNSDDRVLNTGKYVLNNTLLTEESEKKGIANYCERVGMVDVEFDHNDIAMTFSPRRFWNQAYGSLLIGTDDILRIQCELNLAGKIRPVLEECFIKHSLMPLDESEECVQGFNSHRQEGILIDFYIHCGGRIFPAHKLILSARSEVFQRMLQPHTTEFQENKVIITDIPAPTMEILLDFIYTGRIKKSLSDLPPYKELAEAANKYDLQGLKNYCLLRLVQHLSVNNVFSIMEVLYFLDASDAFKTQVQGFIKKNINFWTNKPTEFLKLIEHPNVYLGMGDDDESID